MQKLYYKHLLPVGQAVHAASRYGNYSRFLFSALLILTPLLIAAQSVTGVVTDADGETLIGVNVLIKGTSSGTVTDFDGKYELSVSDPASVLVFSYTGYTSVEETVGGRSMIDVTLEADTEVLEEVVVVGYGVVRKVI